MGWKNPECSSVDIYGYVQKSHDPGPSTQKYLELSVNICSGEFTKTSGNVPIGKFVCCLSFRNTHCMCSNPDIGTRVGLILALTEVGMSRAK